MSSAGTLERALLLALLLAPRHVVASPELDLDAFAEEAERLVRDVPLRVAELEAVSKELEQRLVVDAPEGVIPAAEARGLREAALELVEQDEGLSVLIGSLSAALLRADAQVQRALDSGALSSARALEIGGAVERLRWLSRDLEEALDTVRRELVRCEEGGYPKSALTTTTDATNPAASARSPAGSAWR